MEQNESLQRLVESFKTLPGVGYKTAQRYAYFVLEQPNDAINEFTQNMLTAKQNIHFCKICGGFTDGEICPICQNRDSGLICVVKSAKDIDVMERIKDFDGVYHVLGGTISPLDNKGPNDIRIKELVDRVTIQNVREVVIATNPDVEGDVTAHYIAKLLKPLDIKVTRLAQGISMGTEIEYADEVTLTKAFESRGEI
jgi:recombination protein RecR